MSTENGSMRPWWTRQHFDLHTPLFCMMNRGNIEFATNIVTQ